MDHAELVWRLLDGRTQQQVAEVVGWSRSKVADYARLSGICTDAWKAIVATFEETATEHDAVVATEIDATATKTRFTENLLRPLSSLHGHQQFQLAKDLASAPAMVSLTAAARFQVSAPGWNAASDSAPRAAFFRAVQPSGVTMPWRIALAGIRPTRAARAFSLPQKPTPRRLAGVLVLA